jgi:hypothetical protein
LGIAFKWFTLSAEQGNAAGKRSYYDYLNNQRLSPEQLADAQRMVAEFRSRHREESRISAD